jgi:hypothetical protein
MLGGDGLGSSTENPLTPKNKAALKVTAILDL